MKKGEGERKKGGMKRKRERERDKGERAREEFVYDLLCSHRGRKSSPYKIYTVGRLPRVQSTPPWLPFPDAVAERTSRARNLEPAVAVRLRHAGPPVRRRADPWMFLLLGVGIRISAAAGLLKGRKETYSRSGLGTTGCHETMMS